MLESVEALIRFFTSLASIGLYNARDSKLWHIWRAIKILLTSWSGMVALTASVRSVMLAGPSHGADLEDRPWDRQLDLGRW